MGITDLYRYFYDWEHDMRVSSLDKAGKPVISEKIFMESVRKAAIITGWRYFHTWNMMRSTEGFPDLVLVNWRKQRIIFAELKSEFGKLTKQQEAWIADLQQIPGIEVDVWRPSQMDQIWELLRRE